MTQAYLGLGSNLGDRAAHMREALAQLEAHEDIRLGPVAAVIETEPLGPPGQGRYLNTVCCIETTLGPRELLAVCQDVEQAVGRRREAEAERWGPRVIDLDVLLVEDRVVDEPGLTVPHPELHRRRFVLAPLAQIAPEAPHPRLGKTVREMLADLGPAEAPAQGARPPD